MPEVTLFDAKTHLSKLVEDLLAGNAVEYVLTRHGKPVARLSALGEKSVERRIGLAKGEFEVPEDIDAANRLIQAALEGQGPEHSEEH